MRSASTLCDTMHTSVPYYAISPQVCDVIAISNFKYVTAYQYLRAESPNVGTTADWFGVNATQSGGLLFQQLGLIFSIFQTTTCVVCRLVFGVAIAKLSALIVELSMS